jgi:UDP-N-acetylmuramate: L-alanyl-gamma-D-glutamyl-meso-diaminopimelate ligase
LKEQFPERTLLACMELHTYSSLNRDFFQEYKGSMSMADIKVVYYSAHALQLKGLPNLSEEDIKAGFDDPELMILTNKADLENFILSHKKSHTNLLLMSSGNWDGMNQMEIGEQFVN